MHLCEDVGGWDPYALRHRAGGSCVVTGEHPDEGPGVTGRGLGSDQGYRLGLGLPGLEERRNTARDDHGEILHEELVPDDNVTFLVVGACVRGLHAPSRQLLQALNIGSLSVDSAERNDGLGNWMAAALLDGLES